MNSNWTAAEDAAIVRIIAEGGSAAHAAQELGRTRAAVCGRAHRMNFHFKFLDTKLRAAVKRGTVLRFTADEDKIILSMAAEGKSGLDIAEVINRHKSSIVKRARLLGTKLRGRDGPKPSAEPRAKVAKLHPGNIVGKKESRASDPGFSHVTPVIAVAPLMVPLLDLGPSTCRFPIGDPLDVTFGFCGHRKEDDVFSGVYCRRHAAIAYTTPEMRRRAAA